MKKNILVALLAVLAFYAPLRGQQTQEQSSLLWKITGKDLKEPSYLFGTLHLLTNAFIDTMPAVQEAYRQTQAVAGELIMDPSHQTRMMQASLLEGTTLRQVLPDSIYTIAEEWFKNKAGLDLQNLNAVNPMTVMTVAMAICQQIHFPNPEGQVQLDTYFQEQAKMDGKEILGLEDVEVQINALFTSISLQRQAELLNSLLNDAQPIEAQMALMYQAYVRQDLSALHQLMYADVYSPEEIYTLLDARNSQWVNEMPRIMQEQPTFFAVGALHLTGDGGVISLLRKQGYTVTPVQTTH